MAVPPVASCLNASDSSWLRYFLFIACWVLLFSDLVFELLLTTFQKNMTLWFEGLVE